MRKRWMTNSAWRWVAGAVYAALVIAIVRYEFNARALLLEAQEQAAQGHTAEARQTLERLGLSYPIAMSVPPARQALQRLEDDAVWAFEEQERLTTTFPTPLAELHPLAVDWLPLWGWPACGIALFIVCLTRLGRRNGWAATALVMSIIAVGGTLVVWGWYGYPIGAWFESVPARLTPVLQQADTLYLATWVLIVVTAAMLLCPVVRPVPEDDETHRGRPDSPNDPRMALEYLDAQRSERKFTNVEYARRRNAILMQI